MNREGLPTGFYIAAIIFGVMLCLDAIGIGKAPIVAYLYCIIAAIYFIREEIR